MTGELLIAVNAGEIRIALVHDKRLEALRAEPLLGQEARPLGDIILGRVASVVPAMEAAFVEIGMERPGFLPSRDARPLAKDSKPDVGISACVREGESVLVQVTRDPFGQKGAQLSAAIALPGRFLVLTPDRSGIAVSHRIADEGRRAELAALGGGLLANVGDGSGFIIRTAALDASPDDLAEDAAALAEIWRGIEEKRKAARPPIVLYRDLGPIERALRDLVTGDVARVAIDDAASLEKARAYCSKAMPRMEARLEGAPPGLFEREGLEDEIAALSSPHVDLPSGGFLIIETTHALTAVDVNSGHFTQSGGQEETSLAINLEAAAEIGRQLRLRDIGGLIVVDFIQLDDAAHAARVAAVLEKSLGFDRAPIRVSPMREFGIVAVTRKRRGPPLAWRDTTACPACEGTGRAPSPAAKAQEILRVLEREAAANPGAALVVTAAPAVADWLAAHADEVGQALAKRGAGRVRFESGEELSGGFDVRRA